MTQKADVAQQLAWLTASVSELDKKADKMVVAVRQSYEAVSAMLEKKAEFLQGEFQNALAQAESKVRNIEKASRIAESELENKISGLTREMAKRYAETVSALQVERDASQARQNVLVKFIKQREEAIRTTIGELNQRMLKRMLWGAVGTAVLQVLGFGFLALKMGLFK